MTPTTRDPSAARRVAARLLLLLAVLLGTAAAPATSAPAAAPFKVLAFYNGTWDAAHIDFVKEANQWFPQAGAAERLHVHRDQQLEPAEQRDDLRSTRWSCSSTTRRRPPPSAPAFQRTCTTAAAGWASTSRRTTTDAQSWPWYHNTVPRHRRFQSNTWGPTAATLRVEDRDAPVHRATCPRRSPRRSASGTAGTTTCGRTRTSTSWPPSTRQLPGRHRPQPVLVQRLLPDHVDQQATTGCSTRTSATTR